VGHFKRRHPGVLRGFTNRKLEWPLSPEGCGCLGEGVSETCGASCLESRFDKRDQRQRGRIHRIWD